MERISLGRLTGDGGEQERRRHEHQLWRNDEDETTATSTTNDCVRMTRLSVTNTSRHHDRQTGQTDRQAVGCVCYAVRVCLCSAGCLSWWQRRRRRWSDRLVDYSSRNRTSWETNKTRHKNNNNNKNQEKWKLNAVVTIGRMCASLLDCGCALRLNKRAIAIAQTHTHIYTRRHYNIISSNNTNNHKDFSSSSLFFFVVVVVAFINIYLTVTNAASNVMRLFV